MLAKRIVNRRNVAARSLRGQLSTTPDVRTSAIGFTVTIVDPRSFEFRVCFHVELVLRHCCSVPSGTRDHTSEPACVRAPDRPVGHAFFRSPALAPGTIVRPFPHPGPYVRACLHSDARPSKSLRRSVALSNAWPSAFAAVFWTPGITCPSKRVTNRQIEG